MNICLYVGKTILVGFLFAAATGPLVAADWYVAANGKPDNAGSREFPWDIESALAGNKKVAPGDTLLLREGIYRAPRKQDNGMGYQVKLAGRANAPIHVRPCPNEHVVIDGGLVVYAPSDHLWIWDLEILVSEPMTVGSPGNPTDKANRPPGKPWGGLNVYAGTGCKYINLVIHDNLQGVSFWVGAKDSELHGCLIYDNGWVGSDRGHGHACYTQNKDGIKTISDCIMTGGRGFSLHAYGSGAAYVNNYLAEGNIAYNAGTFLIGGGRPSQHIRVFNNYLYNVPMQLGYGATNEDCEVKDNLIVNNKLTISKYKNAVTEGNLLLASEEKRPSGTRIVLRPNKYDLGRANLAIFNWDKKDQVAVDLAPFLKPGESYRLMDPKAFFGKPVLSGTYGSKPLLVPMKGEFAAFVLITGVR